MSAERDELMRLAREIPEDQVAGALVELRTSAPGDGTSIAEHADELLRDGFGR